MLAVALDGPLNNQPNAGSWRPGTISQKGSAGKLDDRILRVRVVEDDDAANDLNQNGAFDAGGEGFASLARTFRRCVKHFHLEQLAGAKRVFDVTDDRGGHPFLADVDDRLQVVGERTEVGALFRR